MMELYQLQNILIAVYVTTSDFFTFKSPFKIEDFNISDDQFIIKKIKFGYT